MVLDEPDAREKVKIQESGKISLTASQQGMRKVWIEVPRKGDVSEFQTKVFFVTTDSEVIPSFHTSIDPRGNWEKWLKALDRNFMAIQVTDKGKSSISC